jgi:hypothetical protein
MTNKDFFFYVYECALKAGCMLYKLPYTITDIDNVMPEIQDAFIHRSYTKDTFACNVTCKVLSITNDYSEINNYIKE